jgi:hypothetical protein
MNSMSKRDFAALCVKLKRECRGKTLHEIQERISSEIEKVLRGEGFDPEWVGLGTALCVELLDKADADKCADWFRGIGYKVTMEPADADMGHVVSVDF